MSKSPELRLRGYEDDWVTAPLKESLSFISYGFTNPMPEADTGPYMITAKEIAGGKVRFDEARKTTPTAFEDLLTDKSRPIAGDILLTKDGTLGRLAVAGNEVFCINQSVAVLRPITTAIPQFLYQLLSTPKYQSIMLRNAGGSSIKHIYITVVDKMGIATPTLPEQRKIADFLTAVDGRIGQLIQKRALLEDYKKGVTQQLFTQAIRFQDDHGKDFPDWEEKTLGDIAEIKRGASPRPISSPKWFSEHSEVGWVRISDVTKSNKILHRTTQYLTKEGIEKSRFLEKGSLIMSICATIGRPVYTGMDVCIHDGFVVFDGLDANWEYVFYYLTSIEKAWYRYGQPGTQVNLNTSIVAEEVIPVPSLPEQTKIADFLSAIDRKIESVAAQITDTQIFKRGLLQQMFV